MNSDNRKEFPKLLYLSSEGADYSSDILYHGLITLLRRDAVTDYPVREKFHSGKRKDARGDSMAVLLPKNQMHDVPHTEAKDFSQFDYLVLSSFQRDVLKTYHGVKKYFPINKRIVVDGVDDPYIRNILRLESSYYLKRECVNWSWTSLKYCVRRIWNKIRFDVIYVAGILRDPVNTFAYLKGLSFLPSFLKKVTPFPFGIVDSGFVPIKWHSKKYDIAFLGYPSSRERIQLVHFVKSYCDKRGLRAKLSLKTSLSWEDYLKAMSESKICINVKGAGLDTLRYWEIPYVGSLLVSEKLPLVIPDDFSHRKNAIFYSNLRELETQLDWLFADEKRIKLLSKKGREHLFNHHLSIHRAKKLLSLIQKDKRL